MAAVNFVIRASEPSPPPGGVKLEFDVKSNFGILIPSLSSKTQNQPKILRRMPLYISLIMIFSPALIMKWLPW